MYLMDEHAELDVSTSGNEAYKCSEAVLSFKEGCTVNLQNIRLIAYAHLNTTKFPENQGKVFSAETNFRFTSEIANLFTNQ